MIAGDTNDLRLEPILQIHSSLKSVVTKPTRRNPDIILDNVITDLHSYYKSPDCLPPLEPDDDANGSPSDHLIVLMEPISTIDNRPSRVVKDIVVRPMKQSGINLFGYWVEKESWEGVIKEDDIDKKAENFQNILLQKLDEFLPSKVRKICSVNQPFCTDEMTRLKRLKCREYQKNRKSLKWQDLNSQYRQAVKKAKKNYYKNIVKDLKTSNTSQWYSRLKRLCSFDKEKRDSIEVESIRDMTASDQAEEIASKFAKVSQEYTPVMRDEIDIPDCSNTSMPEFTEIDVQKKLEKLKVKKAVSPGDIPPLILKTFAKHLSEPLCNIINLSIKKGQWPKLYKSEIITPVPKVHPPRSPDDLRNISGLLTFNKVAEQLISEVMISDIMKKLDISQYANQKVVSLQHYLLKLINRILEDTDNRSKNEVNAVLAVMVDWKEAFARQCPKLGIESFISCGVRGQLIPLLINYLQDRTMRVKW